MGYHCSFDISNNSAFLSDENLNLSEGLIYHKLLYGLSWSKAFRRSLNQVLGELSDLESIIYRSAEPLYVNKEQVYIYGDAALCDETGRCDAPATSRMQLSSKRDEFAQAIVCESVNKALFLVSADQILSLPGHVPSRIEQMIISAHSLIANRAEPNPSFRVRKERRSGVY